jgi:hypothetical protein
VGRPPDGLVGRDGGDHLGNRLEARSSASRLVPDLSFGGYLAGPRVGAWAYNSLHTTVGPIALAIVGVLADRDWCVQLALIWLAHIGLDRLLGYGLKYPTAFKDTHLQRV